MATPGTPSSDSPRPPGPSPVVIGGMGGSGTRVVAEIVSALGWHLGDDLNEPGDALGFTLLFKHPHWWGERRAARTVGALQLLARAQRGLRSRAPRDVVLAVTAAARLMASGHNHLGEGRGFWPLARAWRLLRPPTGPTGGHPRWGWKEPNSHLFLEPIAAAFPELRYIHLLRHGVDMALSANQQQLLRWGPQLGIALPSRPEDLPRASLRYWVEANRRAFGVGAKLGPERFLALRFEDLCYRPREEVPRIAAFLGQELSELELERLSSIPNPPASIGRHRQCDRRAFRAEDLEALEELGYELDTAAGRGRRAREEP